MSYQFNALTGMLDLVGGGVSPSSTLTVGNLIDNGLTPNRAVASDGSKQLVSSTSSLTELSYLTGVTSSIQTQLDLTEKTANKGVSNGYASLDSSGHIPVSQLPASVMEYKGVWDASTNTPTLADGTGNTGDVYRVSVAGTQNLGSGNITFAVGDWVVYNGTIWQLSHGGADAVQSVNGATGTVTVNAINQLTGDVTAGPASGSASAVSTIANLAVTNAKIANATIDLTTKVTGILPIANGGTNNSSALTAGSVLFSDGSKITQDNSNFFWDATNHRLGLRRTPQNALDIYNSTDDIFLGSLNIIGQGNNDFQTWALYAGTGNTFSIWNKNLNGSMFNVGYLGNVYLGGYAAGHPSAGTGIQNVAGNTGIPTLVTKAIVSQTSDLQDWVNSSEVTIAKVDINGAGTFAGITNSALGAGVLRSSSGGLESAAELSGDVTTSGSNATTIASIQGTTVSGITGTGNVVFSSTPSMSNPVVGTQTTTDNSTKAASTAYVTTAIANAIAGVNPATAVQVATTTASDTSGLVYNNGISGIGATFTGSNNTALTFDGFTLTSVGQRVLVKNDTQTPSDAFNGVYYLTQLQTGILPPILTRAFDYDAPSDINNTGAIPVVNGNTQKGSSWIQTAQITMVGTDALVFQKFSIGTSIGDIGETSFTAADNQSSATNVTGFSFANGTVRSFEAIVSIVRGSTYSQWRLNSVQGASSWYLTQDRVGDDTGIIFSITSSGQVQYTSSSTGSTAAVKFRAITTSI